METRVEPRDGHLPVGALHRLGPEGVAEGDEVHAAQRGGSIAVGVKRGGYAPPEADATSAHPPAVFSDVVMNRTSARAPNRARAGGAGRVGSRDAVIGRRSGVLGDALSPMPTGGVAGGVGDGTWEVSRSSSEMNDWHDWNDVSESKEACGDDDDDGTCRRLNACLSPGGGAGFVGIGYGSGRAGIETPQPMCLRICGRAKTLTKTRARFRLMFHKSSQVPGCAKASPLTTRGRLTSF